MFEIKTGDVFRTSLIETYASYVHLLVQKVQRKRGTLMFHSYWLGVNRASALTCAKFLCVAVGFLL